MEAVVLQDLESVVSFQVLYLSIYSYLDRIQNHLFTAGCGSTYAENCTYFEVNGASSGDCNSRICKCSSDICQVNILNILSLIEVKRTAMKISDAS